MDDHMLDRIAEEINLCFQCAELEKGQSIEDNLDYEAAAVLIKAYNALVKLYYSPEWHERYCKGSVKEEYKLYLETK